MTKITCITKLDDMIVIDSGLSWKRGGGSPVAFKIQDDDGEDFLIKKFKLEWMHSSFTTADDTVAVITEDFIPEKFLREGYLIEPVFP